MVATLSRPDSQRKIAQRKIAMTWIHLLGFGPAGWGAALLLAACATLLVSVTAFAIGIGFGVIVTWARMSANKFASAGASAFTTIMRSVPDLLVVYLFYFGGSTVLTALYRLADGGTGFVDTNAFLAGAGAVGIVSAAYLAEVFRGAFAAIPRGELEAAVACGMGRLLMFRRIIAPQVLRFAVPGIGNVWQLALKESALVSVTGLVELLRQATIGAGSTYQPFPFYFAAAALYLSMTTLSTQLFIRLETRATRGLRRA